MPNKKEQILASTLSLFSHMNYSEINTKAISQAAGVSEALIFKHFGRKKELMIAMLQYAHSQFTEMAHKLQHKTARDKIQHIMESPFHIHEEQLSLWNLIYKLSWEGYDTDFVFEPFASELTDAFRELGYANPTIEAQLVLNYLHGFAYNKLNDNRNQEALLNTLREKYT